MKLIHTNTFPIVEQMTQIYESYSLFDDFKIPKNTGFDSLIEFLFSYFGLSKLERSTLQYNGLVKQIPILQDSNRIILAFSGGKDSVATLLKIIHETDFKADLFFLKGINKSYTGEFKNALFIAKMIDPNIRFFTEKVLQKGKTDFKENPFKNAVIGAFMLSMGYQNFAFGNLKEDTLQTSEPLFDFSDSQDFFKAFQNHVHKFNPKYKQYEFLENGRDSFETIFKYQPELLNYLGSCITPNYRRPHVKKANLRKFGIDNKGCGSCYKCAIEFLFKEEKGMIAQNHDYHKHCVAIALKAGYTELVNTYWS